MDNQTKQLLQYLILPLALFAAAISIAAYQTRSDFKLHVNVYESGARFIRTYQGNKIVIDGGPDDKILSELGQTLPFYDHRLNLLVLTKADNYHATGFVYILKHYEVGQILLPAKEAQSSAMTELLALIDQNHIRMTYLAGSARLELDSGTQLILPAGEVDFGQTRIQLAEQAVGETISDGTRIDRNSK